MKKPHLVDPSWPLTFLCHLARAAEVSCASIPFGNLKIMRLG